MQIGNFSTAYFTVAIALHTCSSLVFRFRKTAWVGPTVISVGWLSSLAIGLVPLKMTSTESGPIYGFDGFSCGIRKPYPMPQFMFHLLPVGFYYNRYTQNLNIVAGFSSCHCLCDHLFAHLFSLARHSYNERWN